MLSSMVIFPLALISMRPLLPFAVSSELLMEISPPEEIVNPPALSVTGVIEILEFLKLIEPPALK